MVGKITRANVDRYTKDMGYEPIQIDSIPEGFTYKKPGVMVGGIFYPGQYIAFIPMADWENDGVIQADTLLELLELYKVKK